MSGLDKEIKVGSLHEETEKVKKKGIIYCQNHHNQ